jgi:hypothetical protein
MICVPEKMCCGGREVGERDKESVLRARLPESLHEVLDVDENEDRKMRGACIEQKDGEVRVDDEDESGG